MTPRYEDFTACARWIANQLRQRAVGADERNRRIVGVNASDQIVGGFLTPVKQDAHEEIGDDPESHLVRELPSDEPHEVSNIGFEWLASRQAFSGSALVTIRSSVYLRVLPTFEEQQRYVSWRRHRQRGADGRWQEVGEEQSELVPVWVRMDPPAQEINLNLTQITRDGRRRIPLTELFNSALRNIERPAYVYPGRQALRIPRAAFTLETYQSWLSQHANAGNRLPLIWQPELEIRILRDPSEPERVRVALRLVNRTEPVPERSRTYADHNLYGAQVALELPSAAHCDGTFRELNRSYRYDLSMPAVGINCATSVRRSEGRVLITTETVPITETERLEPRNIDLPPTFESLMRDPFPILENIQSQMRRYDMESWQSKVDELAVASRKDALAEAEEDRGRFRTEIGALERGVTLLKNREYPHALRAFCLMNEAMSVYSRARYDRWHLFQIVFIVSQLPILAARHHPELASDGDEDVDVLWFAAGGGKTEAFLGLILWQALFDRLRGKDFGVAAVVRFPLRLLAFQQLERMARALAAADLLRQREGIGGTPFSLGYYVGGTQTPNRIDDERHARYVRLGLESRDRRITVCPYCDAEIEARYEPDLRLVSHWCSRAATGCLGGNRRLPIFVVDEDIYRFLPTVVVSTVDKLALLGQNPRFANLLGRVDFVCPIHGASFLDSNRALCPAARAAQAGAHPPANCQGQPIRLGPFVDLAPALLVQDELHLLSEELGTFDAHYETSAMQMARSLGAKPWKVVAATATISRFGDHAWHLYLRSARQFPAPGPSVYDSFYYGTVDRLGRIFVGILGVGKTHTPAVTRTLSLYYQILEDLRRFSPEEASRHIGIGLLDDAGYREIVFYYEVALTYVLTRKGSDQVAEAIESRVKRDLAEGAPIAGELRIETFNGSVPMGEMIETLKGIERADPSRPPNERVRGVVATNIIGHGVDVDRFNAIIFAGFTRLVAEYIQASARVGRRVPGLSVFVATPQSERDRGIYVRFGKFHQYLDRLVDPSALNRWPAKALERTVPGLLAGYLMGIAPVSLRRRLEDINEVQSLMGAAGAECLREPAVLDWVAQSIGSQLAPADQYREELRRIAAVRYRSVWAAAPSHDWRARQIRTVLNPMRSLRDIDDPAHIDVIGQIDVQALKGLIRG